MGELAQHTLETIQVAFEEDVRDSLPVITPTRADYELATTFVLRRDSSLRGPDALHLAIASNVGADAIYSLDTGLVKEAKILGLSASDAGVLSK